MELFWITLASALAGFMDAIVGGGGLILLPALLVAFPAAPAPALLGTNKSVSVWGTAFAGWQFSQRLYLSWRLWVPACALSFSGSLLGAWTLTMVSPELLGRMLPLILLAVLLFTMARKDLGQHHLPRFNGPIELLAAGVIGLVIGFYDGFFGPGTGSFMVFALVRWLGYDFLHASSGAKLMNLASNAAALLLLSLKGLVWWHLALPLALANVVGSLLGTRMALRHGSGFIRWVFMVVVGALILKTGWNSYLSSTP
jgi:uncharacterized membrane protein YfcA